MGKRRYYYIGNKRVPISQFTYCALHDCMASIIVCQCLIIIIMVLLVMMESPPNEYRHQPYHPHGRRRHGPNNHGIDNILEPYEKCSCKPKTLDINVINVKEGIFSSKMLDFNKHKSDRSGSELKYVSIAIGLAITSRKIQSTNLINNDVQSNFLNTLIPSFCATASSGYDYNFFLAYDDQDTFFNDPNCIGHIHNEFTTYTDKHCRNTSSYSIYFVRTRHNNSPAWAQNDAMMEAYLLNMEYYYRVNDDTLMITQGWTESYIHALKALDPPNVGVVGPTHQGDTTRIALTYDFVHYTHIHIHGYYYPRIFVSWFADEWISNIYLPNKVLKLDNVILNHTRVTGQRYKTDSIYNEKLNNSIRSGRFKKEYLRYVGFRERQKYIKPRGDRVIAMCIPRNEAKYTYGAIRNAQLMPLYFPDWILRIYITHNNLTEKSHIIPMQVIQKLRILGAQVVILNSTHIPSALTKYLVMDDKTVTTFITRNPDQRMDLRDSMLTSHWLEDTDQTVFCVRDTNVQTGIVTGLFGTRNKNLLHSFLGGISIPILLKTVTFNNDDDYFINSYLWPKLERQVKCFDYSYQNINSKYIPIGENLDLDNNIRLGSKYNEYEEIIN